MQSVLHGQSTQMVRGLHPLTIRKKGRRTADGARHRSLRTPATGDTAVERPAQTGARTGHPFLRLCPHQSPPLLQRIEHAGHRALRLFRRQARRGARRRDRNAETRDGCRPRGGMPARRSATRHAGAHRSRSPHGCGRRTGAARGQAESSPAHRSHPPGDDGHPLAPHARTASLKRRLEASNRRLKIGE